MTAATGFPASKTVCFRCNYLSTDLTDLYVDSPLLSHKCLTRAMPNTAIFGDMRFHHTETVYSRAFLWQDSQSYNITSISWKVI